MIERTECADHGRVYLPGTTVPLRPCRGAPVGLDGARVGAPAGMHAFTMSVQVQAYATVTHCGNSPCLRIGLSGTVNVGRVSIELIFRNHPAGHPAGPAEAAVEVVAVPAASNFKVPRRSVRCRVNGHQFLWLQWADGCGHPLSEEKFLGRCGPGPFKLDAELPVPVTTLAEVRALKGAHYRGPHLAVEGMVSFARSIHARFIFRDHDDRPARPRHGHPIAEATVLPPKRTLQFPQQLVPGSPDGNPWIWVRFLHGDGRPIGPAVLLGRCRQLASVVTDE